MTRTTALARSFGLIGGLSPVAEADLWAKLASAVEARGAAIELARDDRRFEGPAPGHDAAAARLMYVYDGIEAYRARGVDAVLLPAPLGRDAFEQLRANAPLPIVDPLAALREHVDRRHPGARRLGLLLAAPEADAAPYAQAFPAPRFELLVPAADDARRIADAVRDSGSLDAGAQNGAALEALRSACAALAARGAELVVPGPPEVCAVAARLAGSGVAVLDTHRICAEHVAAGSFVPAQRPFKLGVVGGVGPAATLDFLAKLVRSTPAHRDQDHLRVLVEQNPQIPDRTEHLLGDGIDPTLALYATCRKLEAGEADLIAIPCNTAHAFVEDIQARLRVPIMNMPTETVAHVREAFPSVRRVGVLATTGTIASGVYRRALAVHGLEEIVPSPRLQERVMRAIYGPRGVKAGHVTGECVADSVAAVRELAARGVGVVLLGCTELPLLFGAPEHRLPDGRSVPLVDPTEILARRCVAYAAAHGASAGRAA